MAIRVGIVGAGTLGTRHARAMSEQPDVAIVAVVDQDPTRARLLGERYHARWDTALDGVLGHDVDAVVVATPDARHYAPVMAALQADKDVLVEKPLATDLDEARRMVTEAERRGRILQVNLSQRFVPEYRRLRQIIREGVLGRVQFVQSIRHDRIEVPTQLIGSWAAETSPLYFLTSHDLDLVRWFLEADPVAVVGAEQAETLHARGWSVHDGVSGLVRFGNGTLAHFHASWIHPASYPALSDTYMEVVGSQGVAVYQSRTRTLEVFGPEGFAAAERFDGPGTVAEVAGRLAGAFVDSLRTFLASVRTRATPETSGRDSLAAVACLAALVQTAGTGAGWVELGAESDDGGRQAGTMRSDGRQGI